MGCWRCYLAERGQVGTTRVSLRSPCRHFDGYPAILVQLDHITVADPGRVIVEARLDRAPKRLAKQYLAERSR